MCEGWWTEARNADERSGMHERGTKQRKLVEDTPRELPWIESRSLVRDFWSAVEYGGIPAFLGRLKARGHALVAKWGQDILLGKNEKQRDFSSISSWMQWQWQWSLELCQRWQPQTSATGNAILWNLGPLGIHAAQPYIAQAMRQKAAIVMLQEIRIPRGSKFRVQRDFRRKYPEHEYYIAAGSDFDLVADTDGDQVPSDGYNDGRAHIKVVTFLHKRVKRVFCPKALVVNWHKPREKKAPEHMAHGRILWLDAMTHEGGRISIINIHKATARRPDFQKRVNTHIQAEMNKSEMQRRIMGGDLNTPTSRTGYSISTKPHFEKVDNQFQEFIQRTGGSGGSEVLLKVELRQQGCSCTRMH